MDSAGTQLLVALGANQPFERWTPDQLVPEAARQIALEFGGALRLSALYRTPCFPVGAGPDYVNAAALVTLPRPVAADQALQTLHQIEARFGRSKDPRYALAYTITTEAVGVGFATDTTITRYNLTGRVDWSLTDTESDTRIAGGTAENFTSWSATSATVAAVAAEQDAAKRLMVILADQIAAEILAASVRFTP